MISAPTTTTDQLAGRRVLILGLARQGLAMAHFCRAVGAQVTVSDLRPAADLASELDQLEGLDVTTVLGGHPETLLDGCDVISVSGSVPLDSPFVKAAVARGIALTNDSLEFMRRCRAKTTIGITGSAGKTTTTSLVGEICRQAGRQTWVGGNIGHPLLPDLAAIEPGDVVVQELSSFQLDLWDHSPHIAGVLNITPNHLDRHKTMAAYTAAKANILRRQSAGDFAVLSADDPGAAALAGKTAGQVAWFGLDRPVNIGATVIDGQVVWRDGQTQSAIVPVSEIKLRGRHNLLNVLAATALAQVAGISAAAQAAAIGQFAGVPHRLELVRDFNQVRYINDSIATAPERALAALAVFEQDEPLILLAGGRDKNMVWEQWAQTAAARAEQIILFGALAPVLAEKLSAAGRISGIFIAADLDQAVAQAHSLARPGSIVLLSPGGTSYDSYKDFAERGQHFRDLVTSL